ncbi:MAG: DJ-1/PfpI family protein [Desulfovibrionaceae bacterium]|nr:DJ-1/PfpI family protein [Desulfovibrionaceae bacterium]
MKRRVWPALLVLALAALSWSCPALAQDKGAVLILAHKGFQDTEFRQTRDALIGSGVRVLVASTRPGQAKGVSGMRAETDLTLDEVDVARFDAVVFIGGPGVRSELWDNDQAHRIARQAADSGKILAAICYGPVVLARAGVLSGKRAACYEDDYSSRAFRAAGCGISGRDVEVDGKIITANGPSAAAAFGRAVARALTGP